MYATHQRECTNRKPLYQARLLPAVCVYQPCPVRPRTSGDSHWSPSSDEKSALKYSILYLSYLYDIKRDPLALNGTRWRYQCRLRRGTEIPAGPRTGAASHGAHSAHTGGKREVGTCDMQHAHGSADPTWAWPSVQGAPTAPESRRRSQPRNRPTEHTRSPSRMDHVRAFTFTMGHAHVSFDS